MDTRIALVVVATGIAASVTGWTATDRLEADDDFCNACHLSADVPLHIDIRRAYDARPATNLAALHAAQEVAGRASPNFRCIDCHGGTGALGRLRVKVLAAKDAAVYLTGRFDEPRHMRWPLLDADCGKCHGDFDESVSEVWENPRFHELPVHNVDLGVDCVECHGVHEAGGNAGAWFLHTGRVRGQCARCHAEFESDPDPEEGL